MLLQRGSTTQTCIAMASAKIPLIKTHFPIKKMSKPPSKKARTAAPVSDEVASDNEMEVDERNMGESSSGGATEAGQGLSHDMVIDHKHLPILSFHVSRNLRFSFINSVEDNAWSTTGAGTSYTASYGSDFFEIPHNHTGFYLPVIVQKMMSTFTGYKISNPSWSIKNLQFLAAQENITPGSTPPQTFEMQGNANFTIDTLYNPAVEPPGRLRLWQYDGYGRQRASAINSPVYISQTCGRAENTTEPLPLIQWQAPSTTATFSGRVPAMYRWCRNHKLDAKIGCSPKFIGGWRRRCPALNTFWEGGVVGSWPINPASLIYDAPQTVNSRLLPAWNGTTETTSEAGIRGDIIGGDSKDRKYSYFSDNQSTMINTINPNYYMRIRDPARWGTGATAGSSNADPASQLAVKCVIDIETHIDITGTLDCMNPNDDIDYYNQDPRLLDRNFMLYHPPFYSTTVIANPGGAAPTVNNIMPDAPIDTPIASD